MQSSLHRYLSEKGYSKSIWKDQVFNESGKILEVKARLLQEQGIGKKKNASKAIDSGEEDILFLFFSISLISQYIKDIQNKIKNIYKNRTQHSCKTNAYYECCTDIQIY